MNEEDAQKIKNQIWSVVIGAARNKVDWDLEALTASLIKAAQLINNAKLATKAGDEQENKENKGAVNKTEPPRLSVSIELPSPRTPRAWD